MSQIVIAFNDISISDDSLIALFQLAEKHTGELRTSILSVVLSFLYVQPVKIRNFLINKNAYENALKMILT